MRRKKGMREKLWGKIDTFSGKGLLLSDVNFRPELRLTTFGV